MLDNHFIAETTDGQYLINSGDFRLDLRLSPLLSQVGDKGPGEQPAVDTWRKWDAGQDIQTTTSSSFRQTAGVFSLPSSHSL